jgi:hypothetical protein
MHGSNIVPSAVYRVDIGINRVRFPTTAAAGRPKEPLMNETWTRRLLTGAAAWNLIGGITSLLDPAGHYAQMYTTAPPAGDALSSYFYQCTWINVIAWGLAYLHAAFSPQSRLSVLAAGGIGKAMYFVACATLVLSGAGKPLVLLFGLGDLAMAVLFACAYFSQRQRPAGLELGARPATRGS